MLKVEHIQLTTRDAVRFEIGYHYDDARPPHTGILMMHPTSDWKSHFMTKLLAQRGFGVIGCTNRYTGREAELILEDTLIDWAACVDFLRASGYQKVIGIGYSGGGEIAAGYHSEAVHPQIKVSPMGDFPDFTKHTLSPLDGLVLLNAHAGRPHSITRSLDPSVGGVDGNDPLDYDASLDMFNPANGPPFSAEFRKKYHAAQIERNHTITRWCQSVVDRIKKLGNPSMTDLTFLVHRADANLAFLDKGDDASGLTIWAEDPRIANYTPGPLRGANTRLRAMTVKSWLSQRGLSSSQFDLFQFLPNCHIPTLVICGTADEGGTDQSQAMFDAAPDPGKQLVWVKDLTHFMRGQDDKQAEVADAIAQFARARGLMPSPAA